MIKADQKYQEMKNSFDAYIPYGFLKLRFVLQA